MIPATLAQELAPETDAALSLSQWSASFEIRTSDDLDLAGRVVADLGAEVKALDARRTKITKPLLEAKREVDALFRPALDALEGAVTTIKGRISEYVARRDEETRAAVHEGAIVPAMIEGVAGVAVTRRVEFEIQDPDAVPREFCSPDIDKIRAALERGEDVPGVRLVAVVGVRRKGARRG
jgi:hypothetical protein